MYYGGISALGATKLRSTGSSCPSEIRGDAAACEWHKRYGRTWQLFFDWGFTPPTTTAERTRRSTMVYPDCATVERKAKAAKRVKRNPEAWAGDWYGDHLPEVAVLEMPLCPKGVLPEYVPHGGKDFSDRRTYRGGFPWTLVGVGAVVGVGALIWFGGK
jgi:hypothetical protein